MLPIEKACKWKGSYYMRSEVTVKIKPKFIKEIKSGYPLILKDAIQNLNDVQEEGTIIKVVDEKTTLSEKVIMENKIKDTAGF